VSRQAVSAVESGLSDPSLRVALALTRSLGMTVEEMFGPDSGTGAVRAVRLMGPPRPGLVVAGCDPALPLLETPLGMLDPPVVPGAKDWSCAPNKPAASPASATWPGAACGW
jgi:hypothetical protein